MLENTSEYPIFKSVNELLDNSAENMADRIISAGIKQKIENIFALLKGLQHKTKVYVAFSGGVDSSLILKLAHDVLNEKVIAVTGISSSVAKNEIEIAASISKTIGTQHIFLNTNEMNDENYLKNPTDRCYYCKSELYKQLSLYINKEKVTDFIILDGANFDDLQDFRPGTKAAKEFQVRSLLQEAEMTKEEIRLVSHLLHIQVWDKPSTPCLSSRVAFGERITSEKLSNIEKAENLIHSLGIKQVRVRYHANSIARIEIDPLDFRKIFEHYESVSKALKQLGFQCITVDLEGYKRGNLHLLNNNNK
ncbi:ATP-dependent sacrificial sulfur transferase LarE [Candidatus Woesearchaeota archaeon]|nr:ATP-dependent sacrificial sulfur transferase LarE [Candidatus Woesearchaeota archaeon]